MSAWPVIQKGNVFLPFKCSVVAVGLILREELDHFTCQALFRLNQLWWQIQWSVTRRSFESPPQSSLIYFSLIHFGLWCRSWLHHTQETCTSEVVTGQDVTINTITTWAVVLAALASLANLSFMTRCIFLALRAVALWQNKVKLRAGSLTHTIRLIFPCWL